jgi:hypothetical protein
MTMAEDQRFDSWKEISLYLRRSTRTCYRWAKDLGLPVHQLDESWTHSRVFAYKNEIDKWFRSRSHPKTRQTHARKKEKTNSEKLGSLFILQKSSSSEVAHSSLQLDL